MTAAPTAAGPILAARDVSRVYSQRGVVSASSKKRAVRAVDGVSIDVVGGETLAIVGESGCGKSTLARLLLGLLRPSDGAVEYRGSNLRELSRAQHRDFRRAVQVVFQDPLSSLNPRKRVHKILGDILVLWNRQGSDLNEEIYRVMSAVELTPPELFLDRFPHELSGGQRQRVAIAKAIAVEPELIIADEPLSALDVSVQGQILALMNRLKADLGMGYVLISHDLDVVRSVADRVAVMYLGKVVETGRIADVFTAPRHPYTRSLLASGLSLDPRAARARDRTLLSGEVPSLEAIPSGCRFHPRCPIALPLCATDEPGVTEVAGHEHTASCHRAEDIAAISQIKFSLGEGFPQSRTAAGGEAAVVGPK